MCIVIEQTNEIRSATKTRRFSKVYFPDAEELMSEAYIIFGLIFGLYDDDVEMLITNKRAQAKRMLSMYLDQNRTKLNNLQSCN